MLVSQTIGGKTDQRFPLAPDSHMDPSPGEIWKGNPMSGKGKKVRFHGAFRSKERARQKESRISGAYVEETKINGKSRYLVLTRKG